MFAQKSAAMPAAATRRAMLRYAERLCLMPRGAARAAAAAMLDARSMPAAVARLRYALMPDACFTAAMPPPRYATMRKRLL